VPGVVDVVRVPRGVAVVADDTWAAQRGRAALVLEWDDTTAEVRGTTELFAEYRRLAREPSPLVVLRRGSVTAALADAATRVTAEFEFPYLAHAPLEPLGAVCRLSADRCELWSGAQLQAADVAVAAAVAGLRPDQVSLNTLPAGGSFGRRANPVADFTGEVVSIARAIGGRYPVKLTWTREDDLTGGMYRPMNLHAIEAGLDAAGRPVALRGSSARASPSAPPSRRSPCKTASTSSPPAARRPSSTPSPTSRSPGRTRPSACRYCGGARWSTPTRPSPRKCWWTSSRAAPAATPSPTGWNCWLPTRAPPRS
jgi:CO/xanthine dehydrogenase Mo-binding subunit